jgi:membrane protein
MTLRDDVSQVWAKSKQDLIFTQATALAYTTLVSLVPVLAVGFFIFHAFGGFETLLERLEPFIEENLAPSFGNVISNYLEGFINNVHAGAVGTFGLIGFIFTSISTLATIEKTFNIIWGASKNRNFTHRMTTYWSLLTIGPLLIAISLFMSSQVLVWLKHDQGTMGKVLMICFQIVPYIATGLLFSALYMFLPNVNVEKADALKAGFFTSIVFELAKVIYAAYATHAFAHSAVYGSLVVIPIFLLWLYVIWLVILFGAELCCFLQFKRLGIVYRFGVEDRLNPFLVVDIIEALGDNQVHPRGGLTMADLIATLKLPMRDLMRHIDFLEVEGIVVHSEGTFLVGGRYYLTLPKQNVQIAKIFSQVESRRYVPRSERAVSAHNRLRRVWASLGKPESA